VALRDRLTQSNLSSELPPVVNQHLPKLEVSHLKDCLGFDGRLDKLPYGRQEAFITYVLSKVSLLTGRSPLQADSKVSAEILLGYEVSVWRSALCDLTSRQIIETLEDAIAKDLVKAISNPLKFHERCKYIY